MMRRISHYLLMVIAVTIGACNTKGTSYKEKTPILIYVGNYVTDGYVQRNEGYDWSVVSINQETDSTAHISVRSRADIKKESCSFNATAALSTTGDTLISKYENANIYFVVSSDTLIISSDTPNLLYFFCSGGGSLAGEYLKLHENLDIGQLADTTGQSVRKKTES
ncbi:hypothetical protein ACJEEI_07300 [Bacteroides uniformis]|uniref:hypothetical protein n=1 Tax=Bacteroides uniformis TaxID=820 RepID=UPI00397E7230